MDTLPTVHLNVTNFCDQMIEAVKTNLLKVVAFTIVRW
jgi:hypothetical protein